jgi:hypothetical protein
MLAVVVVAQSVKRETIAKINDVFIFISLRFPYLRLCFDVIFVENV